MSNTQDQTLCYMQASVLGAATVILNIAAPVTADFSAEDFLAVAKVIANALPASWGVTQASGNLQVYMQQADVTTSNTDLTVDSPVFS
jgi:hypothetical protein